MPAEFRKQFFEYTKQLGGTVPPPIPMIEQLRELKREFMISVIQKERYIVGKQYYDKRAKEWRTKPPVWSPEQLESYRARVRRLIDKIDQRLSALEIESESSR